MAQHEHLRGILLTTLGVLILTPDSLLIRLIGTDVWTLLFWRGLLQGLAIAGYYLLRHRSEGVARFKGMGRIGVAIALLYAAGNILFIHSIRLTFVANTLIILSLSPLLGAIFSWLFLRERVRLRTWVAALAGLVGVGVIFSGSTGGLSVAGEACAFGAACLLAGTFVVIRGARHIDMIPAVALSGLLVALAVVPWAAPLPLTAPDALWLILLGGVIAPISFALITLGPRYLTAPEVSLIMLLETVLGPVWVWVALGEAPPGGTLAGGVIVVGTLIVHSVISLRDAPGPGLPV